MNWQRANIGVFAARIWSGDENRRGAVAVLVAVMLVVIIGFVSLGSEVALLLLTSRHMQSAADAAALGGETARLRGYPADYKQEALALSAAAGFADGQNATTVTVNSPPAAGNYKSATDAVEVLIAQSQNLALAQVLYPKGTTPPFTVRARSVAHASGDACVLTLDTTASGSLSMNGTSVADFVGCDVSVNSASATAVSLVGGATLNTNHLYDVGGYSLSGGAQINAAGGITTQAAPGVDPYAGSVTPAAGACLKNNYNPPASITIPAGTYCNGITVKNGVVLTLNPGIYIIDRGSFSVSAGASLSGAGVTIVLTSSTGSNYATASVSSNSTLTLSAPTTGATAGLAIYQDRRAPSGVTDQFGSYSLKSPAPGDCSLTLTYKGSSASLKVTLYEKPSRYDLVIKQEAGKLEIARK